MSKQLAEQMKVHGLESKKKGFALGLGDMPEFVFTNEKGRAIDKDNWRRRVFSKALQKAARRNRKPSTRPFKRRVLDELESTI